jgi:hypothetical protein
MSSATKQVARAAIEVLNTGGANAQRNDRGASLLRGKDYVEFGVSHRRGLGVCEMAERVATDLRSYAIEFTDLFTTPALSYLHFTPNVQRLSVAFGRCR